MPLSYQEQPAKPTQQAGPRSVGIAAQRHAGGQGGQAGAWRVCGPHSPNSPCLGGTWMATDRAELEKLTAPKLRELALEKYPDLTGVSGLKKEELVEAILAEEVRLGLRPKEAPRQATAQMGVSQLKATIRTFKQPRDSALGAKDRAGLAKARMQIKRMKRRLRKLREAS